MKRLVVGGVVIAALAAGVAFAASRSSADPQTVGDAPAKATSTATAETRTMSATEELDGTVGFADTGELASPRSGTLTRLLAEGAAITAGDEVARIDERPVYLMSGLIPMYRGMGAGIEDGADVTQLETNLVRLGHADGLITTPDDEWDAATTAAVKRWQDATGQAENGLVEQGTIVFSPSLPARMGAHSVDLGAKVNDDTALAGLTTPVREVSMRLDATDRPKVNVGDAVTVELPDGTTGAGHITTIGETTTSSDDSDSEGPPTGDDSGTTGFDVTVVLDDPTLVEHLDGADVQVAITRSQHPDVVAVPVTALLALAEGGYAVELDGDGSLVPVELGLFQDGWVEVSGIEAGAVVVVPA